MDSTKDLDLKNLLVSWRCEILYNLFIEEDIGLEELKFIKNHHVCHLLQTFKMGVLIRFEHYLEKWRNHIGHPIKNKQFQDHSSNEKYSCNCQHKSESPQINDQQTEIELPPATVEENLSNNRDSPVQSLELPQEVAENDCPNVGPTSAETPKPDSSHMLRSNNKRTRAESPSEKSLSEFLVHDTEPARVRKQCPFNVAEILRRSGSKGASVTKFYQQRKHLSNVSRILLIQLISEFFVEKEYHLSRIASYDMENEILQMFPTEKLHYYRTEKRGKIYVKYMNMKRNKRKRLIRKHQKQRDVVGGNECSVREEITSDGGNGENNLDTTSCDTLPDKAVHEIYIKNENTIED